MASDIDDPDAPTPRVNAYGSPREGYHDINGVRLYWDGTQWLDRKGAAVDVAAETVPAAAFTPMQAVVPAQPTSSNGLRILGSLELVAGIIVFLIPPYATGLADGTSVVNFPAMFAQYGAAMVLELTGALFICTGHIVGHMHLLAGRTTPAGPGE